MNWLRYSTREMTHGGRRDVLSEHFNDWNWQKTVSIGEQHDYIWSGMAYSLCTCPVDSLRTAYLKALEALTAVDERLENLKSSLGEEVVANLEEKYQSSGGEQFLEDRDGLNCKTISIQTNQPIHSDLSFSGPRAITKRLVPQNARDREHI